MGSFFRLTIGFNSSCLFGFPSSTCVGDRYCKLNPELAGPKVSPRKLKSNPIPLSRINADLNACLGCGPWKGADLAVGLSTHPHFTHTHKAPALPSPLTLSDSFQLSMSITQARQSILVSRSEWRLHCNLCPSRQVVWRVPLSASTCPEPQPKSFSFLDVPWFCKDELCDDKSKPNIRTQTAGSEVMLSNFPLGRPQS